jgi:UDP-glucose 4-epimerase
MAKNETTILITGGRGYIGSNLAQVLSDSGFTLHVLDKKKQSTYNINSENINYLSLDLADSEKHDELSNYMKTLPKDTIVIHLAADKSIEESISNPEKYMRNNVQSTIQLISAMKSAQIKKLIFASTAAVYGSNSTGIPLSEESLIDPISPYAKSKKICEDLITDEVSLNVAIIRFFNAAGAINSGLIESNGLNLFPQILKSYKTKKNFEIFGDNYDTPDGTCIRDYICIDDLISGIQGCFPLLENKSLGSINLGSGTGFSVMEVLDEFASILGPLDFSVTEPREGDAKQVIADISKAKKTLSWAPSRSLNYIVRSVVTGMPTRA